MILSDKGKVKIEGTGLLIKNELAVIFKALRKNLGSITFDLILSDALDSSKEIKNKKRTKIDKLMKENEEIDKLMEELEKIIKKL